MKIINNQNLKIFLNISLLFISKGTAGNNIKNFKNNNDRIGPS